MKDEIANLGTSAAQQASESPHLTARIRLERTLMARLPEILSGGVTAVEVAYPKGSTALVDAAAEDPLLAIPLAEQLGAVLASYTRNVVQVRNSCLITHADLGQQYSNVSCLRNEETNEVNIFVADGFEPIR